MKPSCTYSFWGPIRKHINRKTAREFNEWAALVFGACDRARDELIDAMLEAETKEEAARLADIVQGLGNVLALPHMEGK